jgi:hypothetical protein
MVRKIFEAFSGTALILASAISIFAAGQEEAAIERLLKAHAGAVTEFPTTKELRSILRFFTTDYTGVTDGARKTLKDVEIDLLQWEAKIDEGERLGISYRVRNIKVQMLTDTSAWSTYDFALKIGTAGQVLEEGHGRCTAIFKKVAAEWLIQHSHCSTSEMEGTQSEL